MTPFHSENSLESLMGNRLSRCCLELCVGGYCFLFIILNIFVETPSAALYATPKYELPVRSSEEA